MSFVFFFFFSSRRRHTISLCDWSSDVCSSDLGKLRAIVDLSHAPGPHAVRSEGAKVIVDLGDTSLAAAAPARAARKRPGALGAAAAPAAAVPVETPGAPPAGDTIPLAVRDVRVEPLGEGRRPRIELPRPPDRVHDLP